MEKYFFFDSYPKNEDKKFHRTKFKEMNIVMEIKEHDFVKLGILPVFGFFINHSKAIFLY